MCYFNAMTSPGSEAHEVPVDILPPIPTETGTGGGSAQITPAPLSKLGTFYHPASGIVILGVDLLAFGSELGTDFLDLPVACVLSFIVVFPLVYLIQTRWSGNQGRTAFGKAFLGAFLAGLPFQITGTMFGAAVIMLSGLPHNPLEGLRKLVNPQPPGK